MAKSARKKAAKPKAAKSAGDPKAALREALLRMVRAGGWRNLSYAEIAKDAGLSVAAAYQAYPSKAAILEQLRTQGDLLATWLQGVTPEFLAEMVAAPAIAQQPPKSRFEMLLAVKEHEMHHRGQLMLLERMVGVVPHLTREREARMAEMMQRAAATKS